jgi:hypothetical protein
MAVTTDDAYDMSSAGFSSVFPQSTAWTPSGTGQLYPQSAQDAMQTNALTTGTGYVTMVVTGYPSDTAQYLLSCDLMNKGTSAAAANAANLTISTSIDDGSTWQVVFIAQNAGNNSGAAYYTATATGNIPIAKSANGKIYVRFDVLYTSTVGTRTAAVSNIHIKKAT